VIRVPLVLIADSVCKCWPKVIAAILEKRQIAYYRSVADTAFLVAQIWQLSTILKCATCAKSADIKKLPKRAQSEAQQGQNRWATMLAWPNYIFFLERVAGNAIWQVLIAHSICIRVEMEEHAGRNQVEWLLANYFL